MQGRGTKAERAPDFSEALLTGSSACWTRTSDLVINSHPLYRLSYRGKVRVS